jgi:outer membrane protein TolC
MKNLIYYAKSFQAQVFTVLYVLILTAGQAIFAQDQKLSHKNAIDIALKQNRTIRLAQLDEANTEAKRKEAYSYFYPQINGSAGFTHNIILPTSFIPASAFGGPEGQINSAQFGLKNAMNAGFSANQILFNQAVFIGLKTVKTSRELSQIATQQEKENLVLQVSQTYYAAWVSQEQIVLLSKNLESLSKILKISQLNYENGLTRKLDYERILVNKTNLESQIQSLQTSQKQLLNLLKYLLDLPLDVSLELTEKVDNLSDLVEENLSESISQRTDYQRIIKQQVLNRQERKVLEAGFYPSLSATYQYNYNWQNNAIADLPTTPYKFPVSSIGLSLQVPIFDGLQRNAKIQQNKIQKQKLEIQQQIVKDNSQMEVINAQNKLKSYHKTLLAQDSNQKLAEKLYQQTAQEYAEGLASINDLLNQENSLREAQNQFLSALANRLIAEVELKKASGKLLID